MKQTNRWLFNTQKNSTWLTLNTASRNYRGDIKWAHEQLPKHRSQLLWRHNCAHHLSLSCSTKAICGHVDGKLLLSSPPPLSQQSCQHDRHHLHTAARSPGCAAPQQSSSSLRCSERDTNKVSHCQNPKTDTKTLKILTRRTRRWKRKDMKNPKIMTHGTWSSTLINFIFI